MLNRRLLAPAFALVAIGAVGLMNVVERPQFEMVRTVDVVQLIGTGMCFGAALFLLMAFARGSRFP